MELLNDIIYLIMERDSHRMRNYTYKLVFSTIYEMYFFFFVVLKNNWYILGRVFVLLFSVNKQKTIKHSGVCHIRWQGQIYYSYLFLLIIILYTTSYRHFQLGWYRHFKSGMQKRKNEKVGAGVGGFGRILQFDWLITGAPSASIFAI